MAMIHVLGSSIFFYIFLQILPSTVSISESESLLKLKQSFTNSSALNSWKPGTEPCAKNSQWIGIICVNGLVSSIRLKNMALSGKIDIDSLASLSGLRSVGFVSNSFSGPIPDFQRMVLLKGLYLSRNQFSGEIPEDYFKPMAGLKKVWLSGNKFSGRVPASLFKLPRLMELRLDNNQFSGTIPPTNLPSLAILDMSNNKLAGEIPAGLSRFGSTAFGGNPGLCGGSLTNACSDSPSFITKNSNKPMFMWGIVASTLVFVLMIVGIYAMKWRQERGCYDGADEFRSFHISSVRRTDGVTARSGIVPGPRAGPGPPSGRKGSKKFAQGVEIVMINNGKGEFTMSDLMKSEADMLATGVLGSSYKAVMLTGLTVVVKRIKEGGARIGKEQFDGEMRKLGCLSHRNVVTPLAYHYRRDEKLLVCEYKPKGSLFHLLHGERDMSHAELNWPKRLRIIKGIARGLAYLHAELSSLDMPHGNLKSSNVLLSEENEPQLTDYGLCSVISSCKAAQTLAAYKAPEAILDQNISPKCDVYCLGIIILEVLTGKKPSQFQNNGEGGVDVVQWVRSAIADGEEAILFDPDIEQTERSKDEMEQLLHVGTACTKSNPEQRLGMSEALRRIEEITAEGRSHDQTAIKAEALPGDESPIREVL